MRQPAGRRQRPRTPKIIELVLIGVLALLASRGTNAGARAQTIMTTIPVGSQLDGVAANPDIIGIANFSGNAVSVNDGVVYDE